MPIPRFRSVPAVACLVLSLCAGAAGAQLAAQVLLHSGVASIMRPQGQASLAVAGSALIPGDTVRTEADSTALLRFADGSEVTLRPRSALRIDAFAYREAAPGEDRMHLSLLRGGLRSSPGRIAKRSPAATRLVSGDTTLAPRDADFLVRVCAADCARDERALRTAAVPPAPAARVGAVGGGLSALRPDGRWRALDAGDPVFADDALVTGAGGVAVLFFLDDTRITLQPRSILVIDDYRYSSAEPQRNRAVLLLLDGAARTQTGAIAKADPDRFVFLTPGRRIRVDGTLFDTVVAAVVDVADQAQDAALQAGQAASTAAGQAADAAQTTTQEVTTGSQIASTRVDQGQSVASNTVARGVQAGQEVVDAISSGAPASTPPAEVWRDVQSGIADGVGAVQDETTRVVRRTVTSGGGKLRGVLEGFREDAGAVATRGSETLDFVFSAAGTVSDSGQQAADRAVREVNAAVEQALAVVIPAIIGVARDADSITDAGRKAKRVIGSARSEIDQTFVPVVGGSVAVVAISAAEITARGQQGAQLLAQAATFGATVVLQSGIYVITFPPVLVARASLAVAAAALTTVQNVPAILEGLALLARRAGLEVIASSLDLAAQASRAFLASDATLDLLGLGIQAAFGVVGSISQGQLDDVAPAILSAMQSAGVIVDANTRLVVEGVTSSLGQYTGDGGSAVGDTGSAGEGTESTTAVQVHDGAVTVADRHGDVRVQRGTLVVGLDGGTQRARFDGVVANGFPNPARFTVDPAFLGSGVGETPPGGVYTLVRDGKLSVVAAGKGLVLGAGEAGYTDDQGGVPTRFRDNTRFLGGDIYLAAADGGQTCRRDTGTITWGMFRTTAGRNGMSVSRASVSGGVVATNVATGSGANGTDDAVRVGAAHFAATSGMNGAQRAAYWGSLNPDNLKGQVRAGTQDVAGANNNSGADFGLRGLGTQGGRGVPGEPAGGFSGGNSPRNAASNIEGASTWSGGQRYGGTFGGDRLFGRSGDIAIGAGDGMGNFRGSGRGNAAFGGVGKGKGLTGLGWIDASVTPSASTPLAVPYPGSDGGPSKATPGTPDRTTVGRSDGDEAGTSRGVAPSGNMGPHPLAGGGAATPVLAGGKSSGAVARERDDALGGGSQIVVLNRADAGQMAHAIRRQITAATGGAGGAGDGRTDQQATAGGGPMMVGRGTQLGASPRSGANGTLNLDLVLRINQLVNPGAQ